MAIATIIQWLADPNRTYYHGKLLYEQYGKDIVAKTIINTGNQGSNFHFTYLEKALRAIADTTPAADTRTAIPDLEQFNKTDKPGLTESQFANLPADLKDLRTKARNHFNRAKFLFARIPLTDNPADRLNMALQELNDFDDNRLLMGKVQEYLDKGTYVYEEPVQLKKVKPVDQLSIKELIAESKNLPTYICKDRAKLAQADTETRKKEIEDRIFARTARLEEIERRLNQ